MRQIFIVDACIVDANGTFNHMNGYPKSYDSKAYEPGEGLTPVDIAFKRASSDYYQVYANMCKVDARQLQTAILFTADGNLIESKHLGTLIDEPAGE